MVRSRRRCSRPGIASHQTPDCTRPPAVFFFFFTSSVSIAAFHRINPPVAHSWLFTSSSSRCCIPSHRSPNRTPPAGLRRCSPITAFHRIDPLVTRPPVGLCNVTALPRSNGCDYAGDCLMKLSFIRERITPCPSHRLRFSPLSRPQASLPRHRTWPHQRMTVTRNTSVHAPSRSKAPMQGQKIIVLRQSQSLLELR